MADDTPTAPQGGPQGEAAPPPATDTAPKPGTEQTPQASGDQTPPAATTDAPKADEPKRTPWWQKRIDQITKEKWDAIRRADALAAIVAAKPGDQAPPADDTSQRPPPRPDVVPISEVDKRAQELVAQRELQRKVTDWDAAGRKEFPDFVERCNTVAALGAAERQEFMQIVTDMPDGHKIVAQLAEQPDEAVRILGLPVHRMAMELTKLSLKPAAPRPVSSAPPPIKPVDGAPKADGKTPSDTDDIKTWMAKREAQKKKA